VAAILRVNVGFFFSVGFVVFGSGLGVLLSAYIPLTRVMFCLIVVFFWLVVSLPHRPSLHGPPPSPHHNPPIANRHHPNPTAPRTRQHPPPYLQNAHTPPPTPSTVHNIRPPQPRHARPHTQFRCFFGFFFCLFCFFFFFCFFCFFFFLCFFFFVCV